MDPKKHSQGWYENKIAEALSEWFKSNMGGCFIYYHNNSLALLPKTTASESHKLIGHIRLGPFHRGLTSNIWAVWGKKYMDFAEEGSKCTTIS